MTETSLFFKATKNHWFGKEKMNDSDFLGRCVEKEEERKNNVIHVFFFIRIVKLEIFFPFLIRSNLDFYLKNDIFSLIRLNFNEVTYKERKPN